MKNQTYINGKTVKFSFGVKVYSIPCIPSCYDVLVWDDTEWAFVSKLDTIAYKCFSHEDKEPNFDDLYSPDLRSRYAAIRVLDNFYALEIIDSEFSCARKFRIDSITKHYTLDQL